jgi:aspartate/methionine/tyrosine aminotransferase
MQGKNRKFLADRMQHIQPFRVMQLLGKARMLERQGKNIIHMEVGEPDYDTPAPIIEAGHEALRMGKTHYTPAVGLHDLREEISHYYLRQLGVEISPGRVIVTPGASGALQLVLSILINPGEQVLMADPGYPCNRNFVYLVGGEPVSIPVDGTCSYQLTVDHLEKFWNPRIKAVMLASPSNPTGTLIDNMSLKAIVDFAREKEIAVIVDEIYQGLVYEAGSSTSLAYSDQIFVINSFSKFFGMTGWRVGWLVAPEDYIGDLDKLAQNIFLAAPTPAQVAAIAAFTPRTMEILEQRRQEYRERRDYLLLELKKLGFGISVVPQGAFYIYANCSRFTDDSFHFCEEVLEKIGVAITPGLDFGNNQPENYVRFAYTTSMDNLREGVERLRRYLR